MGGYYRSPEAETLVSLVCLMGKWRRKTLGGDGPQQKCNMDELRPLLGGVGSQTNMILRGIVPNLSQLHSVFLFKDMFSNWDCGHG